MDIFRLQRIIRVNYSTLLTQVKKVTTKDASIWLIQTSETE